MNYLAITLVEVAVLFGFFGGLCRSPFGTGFWVLVAGVLAQAALRIYGA